MATQPRLMLSNPLSGFGVYLPQQVVDLLGGYDTPVAARFSHLKDGGSIRFKIMPYRKGRLHIRKLGRSTLPARIFWNSAVEAPVAFNFRPVYVPWEFNTTYKTLEFTLPPRARLQSATTNSKLVPKQPLLDMTPDASPDPVVAMTAAFQSMAAAFTALTEELKKR